MSLASGRLALAGEILGLVSAAAGAVGDVAEAWNAIERVKSLQTRLGDDGLVYLDTPAPSSTTAVPAFVQRVVAERRRRIADANSAAAAQWMPGSWVPQGSSGLPGLDLTGEWSAPSEVGLVAAFRQWGVWLDVLARLRNVPAFYAWCILDPASRRLAMAGRQVGGAPLSGSARLDGSGTTLRFANGLELRRS